MTPPTGPEILRLLLRTLPPLAGLGLLLVLPAADVTWEHHGGHVGIVLAAALLGLVLAAFVRGRARRYSDGRLSAVALAFGLTAGPLGVHALATPGVLVHHRTWVFVGAVPAGLLMGGVLALVAALVRDGRPAGRIVRWSDAAWTGLVTLLVAWVVAYVVGAPVAGGEVAAGDGASVLAGVAITAAAVHTAAALRFLALWRRRRDPVLAAVVAALLLLAQAALAAGVAGNWRLSWWELHVLILAAFMVVAASAHRHARREGSVAGAFVGLALERTLEAVRRGHGQALDEAVSALDMTAPVDRPAVLERLAGRFDLSRGQVDVLGRAASAVLTERGLHRRLDGLLRSYLSPEVALALVADPDRACLGGEMREVTVLMADLAGFTPFAEHRPPREVVAMLNARFGAITPAVLDHGGTVVQFAGDALMAVFGAPADQPDHADRAVAAGLALQDAADAAGNPDWPRFRVGICTGPALVGNIGSDRVRNYTAIGDTTNLAARLQSAAPPGGVLVAWSTRAAASRAAADPRLDTRPTPPLTLKGRAGTTTAFRIERSPHRPPPGSPRPAPRPSTGAAAISPVTIPA